MNIQWKKWVLIGSLGVFCGISLPFIDRSLPIVRQKESYRQHFPKTTFQEKIKQNPAEWMKRQISVDFQDFETRSIDEKILEKTYQHILRVLNKKDSFCHYRIIDNKLYKFVPDNATLSKTDSRFEKAFKTLLVYANVPDVDFILCSMDGLPEPYMPKDFYLTEDLNDQAPILAQAKLKEPLSKYIVLIPDQFSLETAWSVISKDIEKANQQIEWSQKKEMAFWRGGLSDTGFTNSTVAPFTSCPRYILCEKALKNPELIDAGLNWVDSQMKSVVESKGVLKENRSMKDHLFFKYLPVLDGHMCTYPGYQWRLFSNSVCFKQESDQIQWFYSALRPYEHYIPIRNDMSDLEEKILWAQSHDDQVKEISNNAQKFAHKNLQFEDVYWYLYLVLQKTASIEKIDFKQLKEEMSQDPHWKCIQYRKQLSLLKSWQRLKIRIEKLVSNQEAAKTQRK